MNKKEIKRLCELEYDKKWLELTGLKIGDVVDCCFSYNFGDAKHSYMSSTIGKGTIVEIEDGIRVKSDVKYKKCHEKRVYPNRPLCTKTYWSYDDEYVFNRLDQIEIKNQDI